MKSTHRAVPAHSLWLDQHSLNRSPIHRCRFLPILPICSMVVKRLLRWHLGHPHGGRKPIHYSLHSLAEEKSVTRLPSEHHERLSISLHLMAKGGIGEARHGSG